MYTVVLLISFIKRKKGNQGNAMINTCKSDIVVISHFSEILNIEPAPNNGTAGTLDHLLQNPVEEPMPPSNHPSPCITSSLRSKSHSCRCNNTVITLLFIYNHKYVDVK